MNSKITHKIFFVLVIFAFINVININAQPVAAGGRYSLFICSDSTVKYCGDVPGGTNIPVPTTIPGLTKIVGVSGGAYHAFFLRDDQTVWALGDNKYGQLGVGDTLPRFTPVQVPFLDNIVQIATGNNFSLFLKNNGTVYACGQNCTGQLGIDTCGYFMSKYSK